MSGPVEYKTAEEKLNIFLNKINDYCECIHYRPPAYKEEFFTSLNLEFEEISKLNRDDCFNHAYILYSYSAYLQDRVNENKNILDWSESQLYYLVAKHSEELGFDKYTKHDIKIPTLIKNNSFAVSLERLRQSARAKVAKTEGIIFEIKKMGDILFEKGKRL